MVNDDRRTVSVGYPSQARTISYYLLKKKKNNTLPFACDFFWSTLTSDKNGCAGDTGLEDFHGPSLRRFWPIESSISQSTKYELLSPLNHDSIFVFDVKQSAKLHLNVLPGSAELV